MRRVPATATVALLTLLAACAARDEGPPATAAVLETVLRSVLADRQKHSPAAEVDLVVVREGATPRETMGGGTADPEATWTFLHAEMEDLPRDLFDAWLRENATARDLKDLVASPRVAWKGRAEIDSCWDGVDADEGWLRFHERFPRSAGFVRLSVPAVLGRRALIYAESRSGSLAAWGSWFLLVREDGRWRVADAATSWLS